MPKSSEENKEDPKPLRDRFRKFRREYPIITILSIAGAAITFAVLSPMLTPIVVPLIPLIG